MGMQVQAAGNVARMMVTILSGQVNPASNVVVENRVQMPALESVVERVMAVVGVRCSRMRRRMPARNGFGDGRVSGLRRCAVTVSILAGMSISLNRPDEQRLKGIRLPSASHFGRTFMKSARHLLGAGRFFQRQPFRRIGPRHPVS